MDILDRDFSRRDFMKLGVGLGALAVGVGFSPILSSFGEGGDIGTVEDLTPANQNPGFDYGYGWAHVYFDKGGFYDTESDVDYPSVQGWGYENSKKNAPQGQITGNSADWFWDNRIMPLCAQIGNKRYAAWANGAQIRPSQFRFIDAFGPGGEHDAYAAYKRAAKQACDRACVRAGSDAARVVAVGWCLGFTSRVNGSMYQPIDSSRRTFGNLLPKTKQEDYFLSGGPWFKVGDGIGTAENPGIVINGTKGGLYGSEGNKDYGWDDKIIPDDKNGALRNENWRNYIYRMGSSQADGSAYSWIVLAVADGEPSPKKGSLTVKKVVKGAPSDDAFSFRVTFTGDKAPAPQTFSLKDGKTHKIENIPVGVKYVVEELNATNYKVTWTGKTGTITTTNLDCTCTCTNSSGSLTVSKIVNGSTTNLKFGFSVTFTGTGAPKPVTFTLAHGELYTIAHIPFGVSYTVTETETHGYSLSWNGSNKGTISETNSAAKCSAINTSGFLQLEKDVTE